MANANDIPCVQGGHDQFNVTEVPPLGHRDEIKTLN